MIQVGGRFNEDYPNIELKLFEGNYDKIDRWLADGTIDFGFLPLPVSKSHEAIPLKKDRLLCIMSDEHPLAEQELIYLKQIEEETLSCLNQLLIKMCVGC